MSTGWTHIAVVRKSGTIKVYIDGVQKASKPNTQNYTQAGAIADGNAWATGGDALFSIGDSNVSLGLDCFHGYIDQVHISNIARYESNFTPPVTAQIPDLYTTSYDNFDDVIPTVTGIIKYTGKTANTFTGCTRHNGANQITSGSEIVPISII